MASVDVHVYPLNDLWFHILDGAECPCQPCIKKQPDDTLLIVHNAFDHREIVEQAIAILNGEDTEDGPAGIL